MSEYIYEKVTSEHYSLLIDLFKDAFHLKLGIEDIQKRFETPVSGFSYIGFVAIHIQSGIAAAHYGVIPTNILLRTRNVIGGQGIDAMTHSEHRLKGLFVTLGELTFAECQKQNIGFFFVFPNENSIYGAISKLNCTQIDTIQRLDLKLKTKTLPLPKMIGRTGFLMKWYLFYANYVLRKIKIADPVSFHNNFLTGYGKVVRDQSYIDYKKRKDKFFIAIDDQILWIKLTDVFWIGEFANYNTENLNFINKIKKLAFLLGYNTISFNINGSVSVPPFLSSFKKYNTEASCIYSFDNSLKISNILYTGADFDTW